MSGELQEHLLELVRRVALFAGSVWLERTLGQGRREILERSLLQRLESGGKLSDDDTAVTAVFDHPMNATDLTFHPAEPRQDLALLLVGQVHDVASYTPRGYMTSEAAGRLLRPRLRSKRAVTFPSHARPSVVVSSEICLMSVEIVPVEAEELLTWQGVIDALDAGHRLPEAEVADSVLRRGQDTLLSRSAWIDGLGMAVKTATIFPENPDVPTVNGGVSLYSDIDGTLEAIVDFHLVTKWKTAGDSILAATRLAHPESSEILIVGAGTVGRSLREAYGAIFPRAEFVVWNRTPERARRLANVYADTRIAVDLAEAVTAADIVTCATMTTEPIIRGQWLRPGQHLDLIGAYRLDMREADDEALVRSRLFVDSRETTLDHIGELSDPIGRGVIERGSVVADLYDLEAFRRTNEDEITLFKNGGGAHLDLMIAKHILEVWRRR